MSAGAAQTEPPGFGDPREDEARPALGRDLTLRVGRHWASTGHVWAVCDGHQHLASPARWVLFGDVAGDGFGAGSGVALEGADGGVS